LQPTVAGDETLASVDADGNVAPFGMASRATREVAEAEVAEVTDSASAGPSVGVSNPASYTANCLACHGAAAKGVQGLGLDLTASELVASSSAEELVAFLKVGRLSSDPGSVTGIPMPGFAWMAGADLEEIAAWLKTL